MSSPQTAIDWETFFSSVAGHLREFASKHWPLEADGSASEIYLSLHRRIDSFPFAADVLLLDTKGFGSHLQDGEIAVMIRYDLSQPNTPSINLHGVVPLTDLGSHLDLLAAFMVDESNLEQLRSLALTFLQAWPYCVDVLRFDPRINPARYAEDLAMRLDAPFGFLEMFSLKLDFNAKYNLKPDPILGEADLLRVCNTNAGFFSPDRAEAIRQIQESVAHIQLIPQAPEHVLRVFQWAKRLYTFGLFEYGIFTVACHYAYLAVESAVYNRWNASLPSPTSLQHASDSMTVVTTGRANIGLICQTKGWKERKTLVNGRPYPWKVELALEQLQNDGVITIWQQKRLRDVWMKLRNSYSHLEFASITGPSADTLEGAAEMINVLFDSLKH